MRARRFTGLVLAAGLVAAGLVAAGACNGDDGATGDDPAGTTVTSAAPGTTAPGTTVPAPVVPGSPEDEEAVKAAIARYWEARLEAFDPPDPDHPALAEVAGGKELEATRKLVINLRDHGRYARRGETGPVPHHVSGVRIDGDRAMADYCIIDDIVIYEADGSEAHNEVWSFMYGDVVLERSGNRWKLVDQTRLGHSESDSLCRSAL